MANRRDTKQLRAIWSAIQAAGRPLSVEEIHQLASAEIPSLGLRTVYRAIRRLQDQDDLTRVPVPGQRDRYEPAAVASRHHHHFHCTACDRFFDVEGCPGNLEKLVPQGFQLQDHDLTLLSLIHI